MRLCNRAHHPYKCIVNMQTCRKEYDADLKCQVDTKGDDRHYTETLQEHGQDLWQDLGRASPRQTMGKPKQQCPLKLEGQRHICMVAQSLPRREGRESAGADFDAETPADSQVNIL